jgi:uncharacterized protein YukE
MARIGMDVDQVEAAGRALKTQASALEGTLKSLDSLVRTLPGVWEGQDAQMFVHQWWPEHRAKLVVAISSVDGLGQSALNNASEQREASGTAAGGAVSTGNASRPSGQGLRDPESPPTGPKSVRVERAGEDNSVRSFSTADDLRTLEQLGKDQGTFAIQRVVLADGSTHYTVFIPGTQVASDWDNPFSPQAAAAAGMGDETVVASMIKAALIDAGAGPGDGVCLVGHSLGALEAANLAHDPDFNSYYNVERVVGFGATMRNDIPSSIPVLSVVNQFDPVGRWTATGLVTHGLYNGFYPDNYIVPKFSAGSTFPVFELQNHNPSTYIDTTDSWQTPAVAEFDSSRAFSPGEMKSVDTYVFSGHEKT